MYENTQHELSPLLQGEYCLISEIKLSMTKAMKPSLLLNRTRYWMCFKCKGSQSHIERVPVQMLWRSIVPGCLRPLSPSPAYFSWEIALPPQLHGSRKDYQSLLPALPFTHHTTLPPSRDEGVTWVIPRYYHIAHKDWERERERLWFQLLLTLSFELYSCHSQSES